MTSLRWGDDFDDDDSDYDEPIMTTTTYPSLTQQQQQKRDVCTTGVVIPPTHKSRIDANGIQVVTSYRPHPANPNKLWKTVTKVQVTTQQHRETPAKETRRQWAKFGTAAALEGVGNEKKSIQSKDEVFLEDPNADTDLQDVDPTKDLCNNLNSFWKKQQQRQLERKYGVDGGDVSPDDNNWDAAGDSDGEALLGSSSARGDVGDGGWTQVGVGGTPSNSSPAPGSAEAARSRKYVPPPHRQGMKGDARYVDGGPGGVCVKQPEARNYLNTSIRITNLSENTTEADLQELFQPFGRISRVYVAKDKETMASRGFAFVSFVQKEDAERAMEQLQGFGYDHLILKLEWAQRPTVSSGEFRSGYGKALAQDTKEKVSFASNLTTKGTTTRRRG